MINIVQLELRLKVLKKNLLLKFYKYKYRCRLEKEKQYFVW